MTPPNALAVPVTEVRLIVEPLVLLMVPAVLPAV